MPNMTEESWLTVSKRKTAKLQNKDGQLDDEDSINLQARLERSSANKLINSAATLPGSRVWQVTASTFVPCASLVNFEHTGDLIAPSRVMNATFSIFPVSNAVSVSTNALERHLKALNWAKGFEGCAPAIYLFHIR